MADTEAPKTVESTVDEKKVEEKEKVIEKVDKEKDEDKVEENGEKTENGDSKEEPTETSEEEAEPEPVTDKCSIKRKSSGGDAVDGKDDEKTTPEKKAKIDVDEVEANGEVTEAEAAS